MKQYPLFYYCRHGITDKRFVMQRMSVIPDELKSEVSNKYDSMMLASKGLARGEANRYLDEVARKYRGTETKSASNIVNEQVNAIANASKSTVTELKQKIDTNTPPAKEDAPKRGFLDKLLDEVDDKHRKKNER